MQTNWRLEVFEKTNTGVSVLNVSLKKHADVFAGTQIYQNKIK